MNRCGIVFILLFSLGLSGCATDQPDVAEKATAPLFDDLGTHHHPISSKSAPAQRYFDQGLMLVYGFNHAEAIRSFREAARLDPDCAICYWGIALALGPNINKPMDDEAVPQAYEALQQALQAVDRASPAEQAYIRALSKRYAAEPTKDRRPLDLAYANAMREVTRRYPDDLDAVTLFAESLMDLMPWDYYQGDGQPKAETVEVVARLESVLQRNPDHPGAIHYYIHAVEPSSTPQRAEAHADRLGGLAPGAGHLVHMPSHIYLRVGRYNDASVANQRAAQSDESYIAQCSAQGFYPAAYYPHNIHFLWATSSLEGRSEVAMKAAERLVANVPEERYKDYPFLEEFKPVPLFAMAQFGKWQDILSQPPPPAEFRYTTGIWHYVRSLAFARQNQLDRATEEHTRLTDIAETDAMKSLILFSGSSADTLLRIADHILAGEMAAAEGQTEKMIAELEQAIKLQDELPYTEPPPWYFPVRQALGAGLLQDGRAAEAEAVYREDLKRTPHNGWSLFGLAQSLRAQGKESEAADVGKRFDEAWARADVTLTASRF